MPCARTTNLLCMCSKTVPLSILDEYTYFTLKRTHVVTKTTHALQQLTNYTYLSLQKKKLIHEECHLAYSLYTPPCVEELNVWTHSSKYVINYFVLSWAVLSCRLQPFKHLFPCLVIWEAHGVEFIYIYANSTWQRTWHMVDIYITTSDASRPGRIEL